MKRVAFAYPGFEAWAAALAPRVGAELGEYTLRRFPDGESYVRIHRDCEGIDAIVVAGLDRPDPKLAPLLLLAATLRDLGAARVGLVAPYLAYMRQDTRFKPGEGITSHYFARLLSANFDWLLTVDPHLHRTPSLDAIYSIPSRVVHAAPAIARWLTREVERPLLIGPDSESEQWVGAVAALAGAPFRVLEKVRHGDREVSVRLPAGEDWRGHTPVLVDDIISSGRTLLETISQLRQLGLATPVCIAVHGLFAEDAWEMLSATGARVVTTNTVPHASNAIDVADLSADALAALLETAV